MTVEDRLRQFIQTDLSTKGSPGDLSDDYPLIDNSVIDSLGIFEVVQFIERELGVAVDDEDLVLDNFGNIGDIARLVRSKAAE
ncbi:MAG: acyl carrier protein [Acidimicrobiales bacterium]